MRRLQARPIGEISATVIECSYKSASFVEIGLDDGLDHSKFRITVSYQAHGEDYGGYFYQYEPLSEGTSLPLFYNPSLPMQNDLSLFPEDKQHTLVKWIVSVAVVAIVFFLFAHFGVDGDW